MNGRKREVETLPGRPGEMPHFAEPTYVADSAFLLECAAFVAASNLDNHTRMRTRSFQRPPKRQLPRLLRLTVGAVFVFGLLGSGPLHADALSDAQTLLRQGQLQQALERVDQYLASKPKDAQGRFLKGLVLTELNRSADAIGVFTKLTEDYPELPEPFNNLAVIYAQQKQYDKAKVALEMAIRTHPSYATAHENLGDIYARLASQAYDKALQLDSTNATAQSKLALMRDLTSVSGRGGARPPATAVAAASPAAPAPSAAAATPPAAKPAAPAAAAVPAPVAVPTPAPPATKPTTPAPTQVATAPSAAPAAKPVERKPAADAPAAAGVSRTVEQWAAAWSSKDIKAYLANYAPEFEPPAGASRKAWEQERAQRVTKPGKIEVNIDELDVSVEGDTATARFLQHYRSANLNSSSNKTLLLTRVGDKWLIRQERLGR